MTKQIKITIATLVLTFISAKGYSQVSVSYYASEPGKIGLAHNFSTKTWGEIRLYNSSLEGLTPELIFARNIVRKPQHNVYIGLGIIANQVNGITLPIGVQFTPFEKFDSFSFHIEFQPIFEFEYDILFKNSWGLRYRFKDLK